VADALAIRFQEDLRWAHVRLHASTFFAFVSFIIFIHHSDWLYLLSLSWALFVTIVGLRMYFEDLDTKAEDYRAIAEGLRVKFFWEMAGIADSVADRYLGKQRSELDWIRNGFRGWTISGYCRAQDSMEEDEQQNRLRFVRKYWIEDQLKYFRAAAKHNLKFHKGFRLVGKICLGGVVLLGCAVSVPIFLNVNWVALSLRLSLTAAAILHVNGATSLLSMLFTLFSLRNNKAYFDGIIIGLEALLALAAILHHFSHVMAYSEHAKQYDRMSSLFAKAADLLGMFLDRQEYDNAYRCVRKVGNEALTENGDWVLLHRERPLEVPHP
jgi:hypothetical protein